LTTGSVTRGALAELWTGDRAWAIPTAIVARLVFWFVTQRVWEDALITLSHARNALDGLGLTHHAGEPLTHGFTSAISVLIPLAGEAISPGSGILAIRLVSLLAVVVAIVAADRLMTALGTSAWPRRFVLLYLALDPLQVFYGMAGMETQVAVAILLWSAWLTTQDRPGQLGLSLGLALLVRPDFVIWVGIVLVFLAFRSRGAAVRTVLVAGAVIAPWLIFTTLYYGSPIPQTIIAKALIYAPAVSGSVWDWALGQAAGHLEVLGRTYAPFFENTFVAGAPIPWSLALAISAAIWLLLVNGAISVRRIAPSLGVFVFAYTIYRAFALPTYYFDWYTPPVAAIGIVLAAAGMSRLHLPRVERVIAVAAGAALAIPLIFMIGLERRVQIEIDEGIRMPVGQYLATVVPPGQPVALEAAGYIGYYSGATIYDYPGLTSRAAIAAVESIPRDHRRVAAMLVALRAPWIVVRPWEYGQIGELDPALQAQYGLCRAFDAHLNGRIDWGGLVLLTADDRFEVRRLGGCDSATSLSP
jgi:hypothetical protein